VFHWQQVTQLLFNQCYFSLFSYFHFGLIKFQFEIYFRTKRSETEFTTQSETSFNITSLQPTTQFVFFFYFLFYFFSCLWSGKFIVDIQLQFIHQKMELKNHLVHLFKSPLSLVFFFSFPFLFFSFLSNTKNLQISY